MISWELSSNRMNSSTDWVPSHVQITINQGRELLLKSKSASSELYVTVCTEKEKIVTSSVPKSTEPEWNFISEIPLMSLDTTLHIAVRQKGRLSDELIGYIAIPLSGFQLTSKLVTHWYKLGSRPGKQNLKLRGDLKVSIQLQFKWIQFSDTFAAEPTSSRKVYPVPTKAMLKRTKSDLKNQDRSSSWPNEGQQNEKNNNKAPKVKEKMSVFRRSFRKKNRSPALQDCDEEFTSFSSSPPVQHRACSNTIDVGSLNPEISKRPSGTSISDISSSESESSSSLKSNRALADALEEEETHERSEVEGDNVKRSPAARYYSFRTKKKRWSMHTLPIPTPSPAHTPTDRTPTLGEDTYIAKSNSIAHSPKFLRSRTQSLCVDDNSVLMSEMSYESAGEVNTTGKSPEVKRKQDPESGYNTSSSVHKIKHLAIGVDDTTEATKAEKRTSQDSPPGSTISISKLSSQQSSRTVSPTSRTQPPSAKGSISPSISFRQKPKTLSTSNGVKRQPKPRAPSTSTPNTRPSTTAATPTRSPAVSRTPSGSRLNGARPLSRGTRSVSMREKAPVRRRPKSVVIESSNNERRVKENIVCDERSSSNEAEKLDELQPATYISDERQHEDKTENETNNRLPESEHLSDETTECVQPSLVSAVKNMSEFESETVTLRTKSVKTVNPEEPNDPDQEYSSELSLSLERDTSSSVILDGKKPKHTVAYSKASPLFKNGFHPVSLLPPSLMDYSSQTLPSRSKLAKQLSDSNFTSSHNPRPSTLSSSQEALALNRRGVTLRQPSRTSADNSVMHRRSMNIALLASYNPDILNSIPQSPPRDINSMEDLYREGSVSRISTTSTISQDSDRSSTPSTPNLYGGKSPGEIVSSAFKSRKPSGGLRQAINMYQDSRKQKKDNQRIPQKGLRVEEECLDRSTSSTESSPQVKRNRSAASAFSNVIHNPFSSLRRTKSLLNPASKPSITCDIDTTDSGSVDDLQPPSLKVPSNSLVSIDSAKEKTPEENSSEENKGKTLPEESNIIKSPTRELREDTPTLTDTSSIKTLTGAECNHLSVRRTSSPNPAGAVSSNHIRHTTCSSIGSEGIGSFTSEEVSLDDLMHHDCSHWSKEELVKELIHSKQRSKNAEDELKDVMNYLDNLLLRIMETNPALLSTVSSV